MSRRFRIGMPYFMIYFCALFTASASYEGRTILVVIYSLLAVFWLWQFRSVIRFFRLKDEFDAIMAEAKKRVASGAPADELLEMAKDRLSKMR